MGNRGSATLMFGAHLNTAGRGDVTRETWEAAAPGTKRPRAAGLYDLLGAVGLSMRARGWADNDEVVIGYEIAGAYNHATTDVPSLDVPEEERAAVARVLAALGVTEAPRVILVAGHE